MASPTLAPSARRCSTAFLASAMPTCLTVLPIRVVSQLDHPGPHVLTPGCPSGRHRPTCGEGGRVCCEFCRERLPGFGHSAGCPYLVYARTGNPASIIRAHQAMEGIARDARVGGDKGRSGWLPSRHSEGKRRDASRRVRTWRPACFGYGSRTGAVPKEDRGRGECPHGTPVEGQ